MPLPVVRHALAEGTKDICLLMRKVIAAAVDPNIQDDTIRNVETNVQVWRSNPSECAYFVAVVDTAIVGVVLVKRFWNLGSLFVEPALHGQGIGRLLVAAAIAECKSRSPKAALPLNALPNAVTFYGRLGFE